MTSNYKNGNENKIGVFSIIKKILSTIFLAVGFVLVSWASYISSQPDAEEIVTYDGVRHIIVTLGISCLFIFLFVMAQMVQNVHMRQKCTKMISGKERFKFIFKSFDYWFDAIGFAFMIMFFELNTISPVLAELYSGENPFFVKAKAFAIIVPIVMVIDLFARYIGINSWFQTNEEYVQKPYLGNDDPMAKNTSKLMPTVSRFSAMRFLARTYSINATSSPELEKQEEKKLDEASFTFASKIKSFALAIIPIILIILLSKFLYSTIRMFGWLLITLILEWKTWVVLGSLFGALYLFRILSAFYHRYKFIQRLRKTCKINRYVLSKIKNPYSSLISLRGEEDFYVTLNDTTYSCKLISRLKKSIPLMLHKDGNVNFVHGITFAGVNWFQSIKKFSFEYESNYPQILIINPAMKFVYAIEDGAIKELDNGDSVGKYRVYTGNSFINAVDRNCLNEEKNKKRKFYD